jgi:hypothetical protein
MTYRRVRGAYIFVPEGLLIVARRFIAGSIAKTVRVPAGRLKAGRLPNPEA